MLLSFKKCKACGTRARCFPHHGGCAANNCCFISASHISRPRLEGQRFAAGHGEATYRFRVYIAHGMQELQLADAIPLCSSAYLNSQMSVQVQPIVQAVKDQGDAAVKQYTEKFDRVQLDTVCLPVEVSVHKTLTAILQHVSTSKCPASCCLEGSVFCRIFQSHSFLQKLFLPFRLRLTTFMLSTKHSRRVH